MSFTPQEIEYCTKGLSPEDISCINPALFQCSISKIQRAQLSEEELLLRKRMQSRRTRFRYSQKHPEVVKANLEKLKALKKSKAKDSGLKPLAKPKPEPVVDERSAQEDEDDERFAQEVVVVQPKKVNKKKRIPKEQ